MRWDGSFCPFFRWRMQPLRRETFFSNNYLDTFANPRWCLAAPLITWKLWSLMTSPILHKLYLADHELELVFGKAVVTFLTVGPFFLMRPTLLGSDISTFQGHRATHRWTPRGMGRPQLEEINCQLGSLITVLQSSLMKQSYANLGKVNDSFIRNSVLL